MNMLIEATHLTPTPTHEVRNQARPCEGYNAFDDDVALRTLVTRVAPWFAREASALGRVAGDAAAHELARLANEHTPQLKTHDRFGNRIDWVEFHPAWHQLMALAWEHQVPSLAWTTAHQLGHFGRAVQSYLWNQVENGVGCPTGMAYAAAAGFQGKPVFSEWREKVLSRSYDGRRVPIGEKPGVVIGYAMTEKQGGSDLRQTQTIATAAGHHGDAQVYLITGHKWFYSVPVADGFFTLAQTASGVSCLFVPRFLPSGEANRIALQRLKDKCGNRSNASSEIEFHQTWSLLVGEEGRGIREILSQSHLTRLDFAVGSAGLMRQAVTLALNHAQSRNGFGKVMADLPMQTNVLADLALESEAAMLSAMRAARATDGIETSDQERLLARVATPVTKYWNCQRAATVVYEALQVHGGNGFIMENPIARLYREAPLNSIWEGTSNMMCMDVLRALRREGGAREAFIEEVRGAGYASDAHRRFVQKLAEDIGDARTEEAQARTIAVRMALALQAGEMLRHSDPAAAQRFIDSRLGGGSSGIIGTLPRGDDLRRIVERAAVAGQREAAWA